ncbi:MAG: thioredoxin [Bacteroidia bacterium]|nr:thioredoxin [Bacteroidia bacterium]
MFFKRKAKEPKTVHISDRDFDEIVLKTELPVLLDFWAPWCGPCKTVGPFIDELSHEYEGKAIIGKINVDQNPKLSEHFKIRSIPTIIFIKDQNIFERTSGVLPKGHMQAILNALIEGNYEMDGE